MKTSCEDFEKIGVKKEWGVPTAQYKYSSNR